VETCVSISLKDENKKQYEKNDIKSYWCTWSTQNYLGGESLKKLTEEEKKEKLLDGDGAKLARSMINEENIFSKNGLAYQFPKDVRKELYFMLDDGWDVDYGVHPDINSKCFGSLILSNERFSFATGSPKERLRKLNNRIKKAGWKGVGIWVCAQMAGDNYNKSFSKEVEEYYIERIKWCKYAHLKYWKVDWGTNQENVEFRRRITELVDKLYPSLIIENAICIGPLNSIDCWKEQEGRFSSNEIIYNKSLETSKFSHIFRSYDVLGQLSIPTTIDRVSSILKVANGYVNCEDEMYMGATLGMQLGIMRSYFTKDKMDEAVASIRWFKLAPPFKGGELHTSDTILKDSYSFNKNESWFGGVSSKNAIQMAPAIVSRNTPLPLVKGNDVPYVLASRNGDSYSIGTFKRVKDREFYYPLVDIECYCGRIKNIGIFGDFKTITFKTKTIPKRIKAKSLLDNKYFDITKEIIFIEDGFIIDESKLMSLWKSNDCSSLAIALKICS